MEPDVWEVMAPLFEVVCLPGRSKVPPSRIAGVLPEGVLASREIPAQGLTSRVQKVDRLTGKM
jgi:hypothetical protein